MKQNYRTGSDPVSKAHHLCRSIVNTIISANRDGRTGDVNFEKLANKISSLKNECLYDEWFLEYGDPNYRDLSFFLNDFMDALEVLRHTVNNNSGGTDDAIQELYFAAFESNYC